MSAGGPVCASSANTRKCTGTQSQPQVPSPRQMPSLTMYILIPVVPFYQQKRLQTSTHVCRPLDTLAGGHTTNRHIHRDHCSCYPYGLDSTFRRSDHHHVGSRRTVLVQALAQSDATTWDIPHASWARMVVAAQSLSIG